jgi:hypothetical protein
MALQKIAELNPKKLKEIVSVLEIADDDVVVVDLEEGIIGTYYAICELTKTDENIKLLSNSADILSNLEIVGFKNLVKQIFELYDPETDKVFIVKETNSPNYMFLIENAENEFDRVFIPIPELSEAGASGSFIENFPISKEPDVKILLPKKFSNILKSSKTQKEFYFLFLKDKENENNEILVGYGNYKLIQLINTKAAPELNEVTTLNKFFEIFNANEKFEPVAYSVQNIFNVKFPKNIVPVFKIYEQEEENEKIFELSFIHNDVRYRIFEIPYKETIYAQF